MNSGQASTSICPKHGEVLLKKMGDSVTLRQWRGGDAQAPGLSSEWGGEGWAVGASYVLRLQRNGVKEGFNFAFF